MRLWSDDAATRLVDEAEQHYAGTRTGLRAALAERGVTAYGRSGLNVWIPVPDETVAITRLLSSGWAAPGSRFRISTPADPHHGRGSGRRRDRSARRRGGRSGAQYRALQRVAQTCGLVPWTFWAMFCSIAASRLSVSSGDGSASGAWRDRSKSIRLSAMRAGWRQNGLPTPCCRRSRSARPTPMPPRR